MLTEPEPTNRSHTHQQRSTQLQALQDFDHFWADMPRLFAWLQGDTLDDEAALEPLGIEDEAWTPPPTFWAAGPGSRLEPIRFAAASRLLVELGYDGRTRVIEPYSLRRTRHGNIVLHAVRANHAMHRSYRVDRIQSAAATTRPFTPRHVVEFTSTGPIAAPQTRPPRPRTAQRSTERDR